MELTATVISGFAGIALSLILNYVPGLNVKFAALSSELKSLVVALSLLGIAILVAGSSCLGLWIFMPCTKEGFMLLAQCLLSALVANQGAYQLSPQTQAVKDAKK